MIDIATESLRAGLLAVILIGLIYAGRTRQSLHQPGWRVILAGFALLLFGCVLDISDNFESLNRFVVVGDTEVEAILEKVVGFLGGFILLALGLWLWLPTLASMDELRVARQELQKKNRALELADQTKDDFLANMSHELRTPLSAVLSYAELIREPTSLAEENRLHAEVIETNSKALLSLINDILDLSKVRAGKLNVLVEPVKPGPILEQVRALLQPKAAEKSLSLTTSFSNGDDALVQVDPMRLRQVLINLIGNALKFTQQGSVELRVERDGDSWLSVKIIDTGLGMTAEQVERIFMPFEQAEQTTAQRFGGTGLGLSLSQRLVELMDGELTVESQPGQGSTFTVRLRLAEAQLDENATSNPPSPGRDVSSELEGATQALPQPTRTVSTSDVADAHDVLDAPVRVLLAEDAPDLAKFVQLILKREGHHCVHVDNGVDAFEEAMGSVQREQPFDLVLMDVQMPRLDGLSACCKLREAGYTGTIVALTAHASPEDRRRCLDAGADDHVAKPLAPATLRKLLEGVGCASDTAAVPGVG